MCDPCKLREIIILGQHKVATLIHIWVDCLGHLEKPVLAQGESRSTRVITLGPPPRLKGIIRYFMPRNFRVQPQAIMGSGIVE